MSLFVESIKIRNGKIFLLDLHQERVHSTFSHFGKEGNLNLEEICAGISFAGEDLFKLRIIYSLDRSYTTELIPYFASEISDFLLVLNNNVEYTFKSNNRDQFDLMKGNADGAEIIIVKGHHITDTSYSNLIFLKDDEWFTPSTFLLNGVQRRNLLTLGKIKEVDIMVDNLKDYSHFKMINALNDFDDALTFPISRILNLPDNSSSSDL